MTIGLLLQTLKISIDKVGIHWVWNKTRELMNWSVCRFVEFPTPMTSSSSIGKYLDWRRQLLECGYFDQLELISNPNMTYHITLIRYKADDDVFEPNLLSFLKHFSLIRNLSFSMFVCLFFSHFSFSVQYLYVSIPFQFTYLPYGIALKII